MTYQVGGILIMVSLVVVVNYVHIVHGEEAGLDFIMWLIATVIVGMALFGHR